MNTSDVNNFWIVLLKEMGRPSPSQWQECDVALGPSGPNKLGQQSKDGGARRQKETNSCSLCGTKLLFPCNRQNSQCHITMHIYFSLVGLGVGWAVLFDMKPWICSRLSTNVLTWWSPLYGMCNRSEWPLSDHIQLPKWVALNTQTALLQDVGQVQLCPTCVILITR